MVISFWGIVLILLLLLALGGAGGGYYSGGAYASPLAGLAMLLLIGLIVWVLLGGPGFWIGVGPAP
jgi:hypothetical protein